MIYKKSLVQTEICTIQTKSNVKIIGSSQENRSGHHARLFTFIRNAVTCTRSLLELANIFTEKLFFPTQRNRKNDLRDCPWIGSNISTIGINSWCQWMSHSLSSPYQNNSSEVPEDTSSTITSKKIQEEYLKPKLREHLSIPIALWKVKWPEALHPLSCTWLWIYVVFSGVGLYSP